MCQESLFSPCLPQSMLVRYLTSSLIITMAYAKLKPNGPSHGYVITNAFCKNDLMVASYPCNEGGMLDMCVIGATSHEVGQALCSQHHYGYE